MATPLSLDALTQHGDNGMCGSYEQEFPCLAEPAVSPEIADLLDAALDALPADVGRCVELVVIAGLSYRDAAVELDWTFGDGGLPDKKRVWRAVQVGLNTLREGLVHPPAARTLGA